MSSSPLSSCNDCGVGIAKRGAKRCRPCYTASRNRYVCEDCGTQVRLASTKRCRACWRRKQPGRAAHYLPSQETKTKISQAMSGERSPFWKDGRARMPYAPGFSASLKKAIRERDGHSCQACGDTETSLHVYHIGLEKVNHDPQNLVCLCPQCHKDAHRTPTGGAHEFS